MSIYVKLNGAKYQLPDNLTIGRGSPFRIDDKTFARRHARIKNKNGKYFIKDLGSKKGTLKNGQSLSKGKFVEVKPGEKIYLGTAELEICEKFSGPDVIKVKSLVPRDTASMVYLAFIPVAYFAYGIFKSDPNSRIAFGFFGVLIILVLFTSYIVRKTKLLRIIIESTYSKDGMTLSFDNTATYSFNFKDVKSWNITGNEIMLEVHSQKHVFRTKTEKNLYQELLNQHCPKARLKVRHKFFRFLVGASAAPVVLAYFLLFTMEDLKFLHYTTAVFLLFSLVLLVSLLSPGFRSRFLMPDTFDSVMSKIAAGSLLLVTLTNFPIVFQRQTALIILEDQMKRCQESVEDCRDLDFAPMMREFLYKGRMKVISETCKLGNMSACNVLTKNRVNFTDTGSMFPLLEE